MSISRGFVIEMFRHIDGRAWEGLRQFFHPEVVYERPGYPPIVGLDELLRFYREVRVIGGGEHQLASIVVGESAGACWGRFVGRHRDGTALDERFADCYTFEAGGIKTRASYFFRPAI
jgi:ketosteroid isomerase-like protein